MNLAYSSYSSLVASSDSGMDSEAAFIAIKEERPKTLLVKLANVGLVNMLDLKAKFCPGIIEFLSTLPPCDAVGVESTVGYKFEKDCRRLVASDTLSLENILLEKLIGLLMSPFADGTNYADLTLARSSPSGFIVTVKSLVA